jgi:hypothetical protein
MAFGHLGPRMKSFLLSASRNSIRRSPKRRPGPAERICDGSLVWTAGDRLANLKFDPRYVVDPVGHNAPTNRNAIVLACEPRSISEAYTKTP